MNDVFGLFMALACAACSSSPSDSGSTNQDSATAGEVTFSMLQSQVFNVSCTFSSCHNASTPQQGLNLTPSAAYANLVNVPSTELADLGVTGNRVVPGEPDHSYLIEKLKMSKPRSGAQMPVGQPLDAARLDMVVRWVDAGAPDN